MDFVSSFQNPLAWRKMVYLFCVFVGVAGRVFSVDIDVGKRVDALKTAIKDDNPSRCQCDRQDLSLFLAKKDGTWLKSDDPDVMTVETGAVPEKVKNIIEHDEINPTKKIGDIFANAPTEDVIHVLVVARSYVTVATRLDCSAEWLMEFLSNEVKFHLLPPVATLKDFVKQPLPVKIPMESKVLTSWSFYLNKNDQEKLFTTDDVASCQKIRRKIEAMVDPLRSGDTAGSFIWFWDTMIRSLLDFLFVFGDCDRNSCENSSTKKKCPDFVFLLNDVVVFRGVEEDPRVNITSPRDEICENLVWVFGTVPYVFAYAASGYKISLFALVRDSRMSSKVTSVPIETFDLERGSDRFRFVLALLNVSLLFTSVADGCPSSAKSEYRIFKQSGTESSGAEVRLYLKFVEKIFPSPKRFQQVKFIYSVLQTEKIPNVDRVKHVKPAENMIVFEPRGILDKPSNLLELFVALRNVLEALVVLHRASWMHRDIRWPNVIKRRDCNSWFLIDFADAAREPQPYPCGKHLSKEEHAPEIFVKGGVHTTAVDIWAVGYLIQESDVEWDDVGARTAFLMRLMQQDATSRPTAEEALRDLKALEEAEQEAGRELQQKLSRKRKIP